GSARRDSSITGRVDHNLRGTLAGDGRSRPRAARSRLSPLQEAVRGAADCRVGRAVPRLQVPALQALRAGGPDGERLAQAPAGFHIIHASATGYASVRLRVWGSIR